MNSNSFFYKSPIGILKISADEIGVTGLEISMEGNESAPEELCSPIIQQAVSELKEYFEGSRKEFHVPVHVNGTVFQGKVWNALREIPYGETRSYQQIANAAGSPKACRAVGGANHNNPVMIIVPCHRVIGANGSLTGFGGGLSAKEYLLRLEGAWG